MKRGQFGFVSKLILVVISSIILLAFSTQLFGMIGSFSKEGGCKASAIANSVGNTVSVGTDPVKLDCKPKYIKVTEKKSLFEGFGEDKDFIIKEVAKPLTTAEKNKLDKVRFFNPEGGEMNLDSDAVNDNEDILYTYRLNQIVADEMRKCWDNMGQGKLDLFSSWFRILGEEGDDSLIDRLSNNNNEAPTVCVLCSTVDIDREVYEIISDRVSSGNSALDDYENNPNSLIYWLTHTPIPRTSVSYYEYLLDDSNNDVFAPENRNFEYDQDTFAIVFARTNVHKITSILENMGNSLSELLLNSPVAEETKGTSALHVVPYDSDNMGRVCSKMAN
ncbi:MAG: hypothetical protein R6V50_01725 [Thermoplasmatota archaeon]